MIIMLTLAIVGCDYYENILDEYYKPELIDNPQYNVTIKGRIDPSIKLSITTLYATTSKSCRKTVNWLKGAKSNRSHRFLHPVSTNNGYYEVHIQYEKLKPGKCNWKISSIEYTLVKNNTERKDHIFPSPLTWFTTETSNIPDFSIECDFSMTIKSGKVLPCRRPQGNYYLGTNQTELDIDFIERKWIRTRNTKLNNLTSLHGKQNMLSHM